MNVSGGRGDIGVAGKYREMMLYLGLLGTPEIDVFYPLQLHHIRQLDKVIITFFT